MTPHRRTIDTTSITSVINSIISNTPFLIEDISFDLHNITVSTTYITITHPHKNGRKPLTTTLTIKTTETKMLDIETTISQTTTQNNDIQADLNTTQELINLTSQITDEKNLKNLTSSIITSIQNHKESLITKKSELAKKLMKTHTQISENEAIKIVEKNHERAKLLNKNKNSEKNYIEFWYKEIGHLAFIKSNYVTITYNGSRSTFKLNGQPIPRSKLTESLINNWLYT